MTWNAVFRDLLGCKHERPTVPTLGSHISPANAALVGHREFFGHIFLHYWKHTLFIKDPTCSSPGSCILSITIELFVFRGLFSLHGFLVVKLNMDLKITPHTLSLQVASSAPNLYVHESWVSQVWGKRAEYCVFTCITQMPRGFPPLGKGLTPKIMLTVPFMNQGSNFKNKCAWKMNSSWLHLGLPKAMYEYRISLWACAVPGTSLFHCILVAHFICSPKTAIWEQVLFFFVSWTL